jgi:hypothetical protein
MATGERVQNHDQAIAACPLCRPCHDAVKATVFVFDSEPANGIEDIPIESVLRFATDHEYACAHSAGYALHRCEGEGCRCACRAFRERPPC